MDISQSSLLRLDTSSEAEGQPLRYYAKRALQNYFSQLGDHKPSRVYDLVAEEFEIALIEEVLKYTDGNQSKASDVLGKARGTVRKMIKKYLQGKQKEKLQ